MGIKEKWLESLPEQFRGQPNIEVIIGSWAKQLEEVEAVLAELLANRGFDDAEGAQLDRIGDIVVLTRPESALYAGVIDFDVIDDERYRLFLKYKALRNSNQCTFPELVAACKLLYGAEMVYYREEEDQPARFYLNIGAKLESEILSLLQSSQLIIKPGGVSVDTGFFDTEFFGFSDTNHLALGFGMGSFAQQILTRQGEDA